MSAVLAKSLADSLLFLDDPRAQSTFASYFSGTNVSQARAFEISGRQAIPQTSRALVSGQTNKSDVT